MAARNRAGVLEGVHHGIDVAEHLAAPAAGRPVRDAGVLASVPGSLCTRPSAPKQLS